MIDWSLTRSVIAVIVILLGMAFNFTDFEMPLIQALFKLGGKAKTKDVYPEVEKIMGLTPDKFPEEY